MNQPTANQIRSVLEAASVEVNSSLFNGSIIPKDSNTDEIAEIIVKEGLATDLINELRIKRIINDQHLIDINIKKQVPHIAPTLPYGGVGRPIEGSDLIPARPDILRSSNKSRKVKDSDIFTTKSTTEDIIAQEIVDQNKKFVCAISVEYPYEKHVGTGALVRNDMILTNYHVYNEIRELNSREFLASFNDKRDKNNFELIEPAVNLQLTLDDYIAGSEPSLLDEEEPIPSFESTGWEDKKLDFALFRFTEDARISNGDERESSRISNDYCKINPLYQFIAEERIYIIQFPVHGYGEPVQCKHSNGKLISPPTDLNENRIGYKASTLRGSSGAPCFNQGGELVGIHRGSDGNYDGPNSQYNIGIPISAILNYLNVNSFEELMS